MQHDRDDEYAIVGYDDDPRHAETDVAERDERDPSLDPLEELRDEFAESGSSFDDEPQPWDSDGSVAASAPLIGAEAGDGERCYPPMFESSHASGPETNGSAQTRNALGARSTFLFDVDPTSGERVPSKARFAVAAVALLAAVTLGFWVVKAQGDGAGDVPLGQAAKAADEQRGPVVKGSNLPPRAPRFGSPGLDEIDEPPPADVAPPEPTPAAPPAPPAERPTAPASWRAGIALTVTREDDVDDDGDDVDPGLGIVLVEGTQIPASLIGKIDAPDTGLQPDLNRIKAVLDEPFAVDGKVIFPAGTEFLGRVQQTTDKKVHVLFHRVVLPDKSTAPCKAIALDSDLAAGVRADKIEKYRKRNVMARVGRGVVDAAVGIATLGRSGAGAVGVGAASGAADQAREETDGLRRPTRLYHVSAGRRIWIELGADLSL